MNRIFAAIVFGVLSGPVLAQEVPFDPTFPQSCLDNGKGRECIGQGVEPCAQAMPGGASNIGYSFCLAAELSWWDVRLNSVYAQLVAQAERIDTEALTYGTPDRPSDIAALRGMQRAWIDYRDATCGYEELQWWGGTGANGVSLACLMRVTGEQSLYLEGLLFD